MKDIDILISKFLSTDIKTDELECLYLWIEKSEENKIYFSESKQLWMSLEQNDSGNDDILNEEFTKFLDKVVELEKPDKAVGEQKNEETKEAKIIRLNPKKNKVSWLKIASALVLPLLAGTIYFFAEIKQNPQLSSVEMKEINVPKGSKLDVILPDGTRVSLNSGSKLNYPSNFDSKVRRVKLMGEAFFHVTKDSICPFVVSVKDLKIRVLGTSFNVNAYSENRVVTSLVEGKVELFTINNRDTKILKPGFKIIYNINKLELMPCVAFDTDVETAWMRGEIIMENTPIFKLISFLENKFDVSIEINNDIINDYKFTGKFDDESLIEILDMLKISSSFSYNIKDKKVSLFIP